MPIKKLDTALHFLQGLYDDHQPNEYGNCDGNHGISGHQEEAPDWPCYFHQSAANILGLPEIEYVDTRVRHEPTVLQESVQKIWGPTVLDQLKPTADQQQLQAQYILSHWKPDAE